MQLIHLVSIWGHPPLCAAVVADKGDAEAVARHQARALRPGPVGGCARTRFGAQRRRAPGRRVRRVFGFYFILMLPGSYFCLGHGPSFSDVGNAVGLAWPARARRCLPERFEFSWPPPGPRRGSSHLAGGEIVSFRAQALPPAVGRMDRHAVERPELSARGQALAKRLMSVGAVSRDCPRYAVGSCGWVGIVDRRSKQALAEPAAWFPTTALPAQRPTVLLVLNVLL